MEIRAGAPAGLATTGGAQAPAPNNVKDAAQQFEALLVSEVLKSARGESSWFGGEDESLSSLSDYAESQMAQVMAERGGLGLSELIMRGLQPPAEGSAKPGE